MASPRTSAVGADSSIAAAPDSLAYEVNIRLIDGTATKLQVPRDSLGRELKSLIFQKLAVPCDMQRLICRGHAIQDDDSVGQHITENGQTVHLVQRPPAQNVAPTSSHGPATTTSGSATTAAAAAPGTAPPAAGSSPQVQAGGVTAAGADGSIAEQQLAQLLSAMMGLGGTNGRGGAPAGATINSGNTVMHVMPVGTGNSLFGGLPSPDHNMRANSNFDLPDLGPPNNLLGGRPLPSLRPRGGGLGNRLGSVDRSFPRTWGTLDPSGRRPGETSPGRNQGWWSFIASPWFGLIQDTVLLRALTMGLTIGMPSLAWCLLQAEHLYQWGVDMIPWYVWVSGFYLLCLVIALVYHSRYHALRSQLLAGFDDTDGDEHQLQSFLDQASNSLGTSESSVVGGVGRRGTLTGPAPRTSRRGVGVNRPWPMRADEGLVNLTTSPAVVTERQDEVSRLLNGLLGLGVGGPRPQLPRRNAAAAASPIGASSSTASRTIASPARPSRSSGLKSVIFQGCCGCLHSLFWMLGLLCVLSALLPLAGVVIQHTSLSTNSTRSFSPMEQATVSTGHSHHSSSTSAVTSYDSWAFSIYLSSLLLGVPVLYLSISSKYMLIVESGAPQTDNTSVTRSLRAQAGPTRSLPLPRLQPNRTSNNEDLVSLLLGDAVQAAEQRTARAAPRNGGHESNGNNGINGFFGNLGPPNGGAGSSQAFPQAGGSSIANEADRPHETWRDLSRLNRDLALLLGRADAGRSYPPPQMPYGELHALLSALLGATGQLGVGIGDVQAAIAQNGSSPEQQRLRLAALLDQAATAFRGVARSVRQMQQAPSLAEQRTPSIEERRAAWEAQMEWEARLGTEDQIPRPGDS